MGRFRATEIDHYGGQGGTGYFSLKNDKEVAKVRFMYDTIDDIDGYSVHQVEIDGKKRYVNCLRDYNDPIDVCPFCKNRMFTQAKLFVPIYNKDTQKVQVWERGKKFYSQLSGTLSRCSKDASIAGQVFEIERNGKPHDTATTYGIFAVGQPDDTKVADLPEKPKIMGGLILDKTAEEMDYYLHNGEFPESSNAVTPTRRQPVNSDDDMPRRIVRRTPARREDVY